MSTEPKQVNPSLQKKSAARMAAVQCLYTAALTGDVKEPAQQVALLKKNLANNKGEQKLLVGSPIEPNYKLVETLLAGIAENLTEIDTRVDGALSGSWKRDRMSPLLLAILQCSIYEMFFAREIAPKIIIDEYTRLTRSFCDDSEVNFVHGALSTLSQQYG